MTRRTLLSLPLAVSLHADSGDDIHALMDSALDGLRNHKEKQFLAAFDPAMKGYRELAVNVRGLLRDADAQASIEISPSEMKWTLDIDCHDSSAGETKRQVTAKYATATNSGKLLITSFEPVALFAPPHGREAWEVLTAVARDLQVASSYADPQQAHLMPGQLDLPNFLSCFDPAMPGYAQLETNVRALTAAWLVEPGLQLTSNQGSDDRRALEIDWDMTLTNPQNTAHNTRTQQTVKCVVEKRGRRWLIVSFEPLEIFAPPKA